MFKHIHFVGIKGVGMSALAQLFYHQGAAVSGSDVAEEFPTDKNLAGIGVSPSLFDENNITSNLDCVVYSRAYKDTHPEIQKARQLNIPLMDYGEALAYLFNRKKGIVVTGTHGKTTTTAMLAKIFEDAGLEPSVLVGGEVLDWNNNMRAGSGEYFIAEGDEYQEKFLNLEPQAILITNIEYDHPDFFPDFSVYKNAFRKLIGKLKPDGLCVVFEEDKNSLDVSDDLGSGRIIFGSKLQADIFKRIKLYIPGYHNRINALGAFALVRNFGIDEDLILKSLAEFHGVKRRLEHYNGPEQKFLIIDDYAHHPTEIRASISALRETYPDRKIVLAFQPHTFSRTEALLGDFIRAFDGVHFLAIADIYTSAREAAGEINSSVLAARIKKRGIDAVYAPCLDDVYKLFEKIIGSAGDEKYIFVTMGAGDIWKVARDIKMKYNL